MKSTVVFHRAGVIGRAFRSMVMTAGLCASLFVTAAALAQDHTNSEEGRPQDQQPEQPQTEPAATEEKEEQPAEEKLVYAKMETNMGDIYVELNKEKAPLTVENILRYIKEDFYNGTIFHRVIPNFVIQAGGFTEDMTKKSTYAGVKNEWENGLKNERGTLSMARIGGRPDSGSSQFFISLRDNPSLDRPQNDGAAYAVFGKVIVGMDVVDKIATVPLQVSSLGSGEKSEPVDPVVIKTVRLITADEAAEAVKKSKAGEAAEQPKTEGQATSEKSS